MAQETKPSELAVFFSVTCAIPALHNAIPVVCVICVVCDGGNLVLNKTVLAPSGSNKISHKNIPKVNLNSHLHIEAFTKMFFCIFYQSVF